MNIQWKVVYYVSARGDIPVKEFLDVTEPRTKTKILRILMHFEEYGLPGIISHIKKLTGTQIWEIRVLGKESIRMLCMTIAEKQLLLLHAFQKKTHKTPAKEIAVAAARLKEYGVKAGS